MNLIFKTFSVGKMSGGPYNYNYIFKYIIIGDMGVGKSCILHQFTEKKCKWTLILLWNSKVTLKLYVRSYGKLSTHNRSRIWNENN